MRIRKLAAAGFVAAAVAAAPMAALATNSSSTTFSGGTTTTTTVQGSHGSVATHQGAPNSNGDQATSSTCKQTGSGVTDTC